MEDRRHKKLADRQRFVSRDETYRGYEGESIPNLKNLPFDRAKKAVQCAFPEQLTGPGIICSTTVTKKQRSQTEYSNNKRLTSP